VPAFEASTHAPANADLIAFCGWSVRFSHICLDWPGLWFQGRYRASAHSHWL